MHITSFEKELNAFQSRLMRSWQERHDQQLGVSIQVGNLTVQNCESITRTESEVNPYCASIIKSHLADCNALDFYLKGRAETYWEQDAHSNHSLSCRCHQGISNILVPYRHPDDKGKTLWHIFIGQFLLVQAEKPAEQEVCERACQKYKLIDVINNGVQLQPHEEPFIKKDAFIPRREVTTHFRGKGIARLEWHEFFSFQEHLIGAFTEFLRAYYSRGRPSSKLQAFLKGEQKPEENLAGYITGIQVQMHNLQRYSNVDPDHSLRIVHALDALKKVSLEDLGVKKLAELLQWMEYLANERSFNGSFGYKDLDNWAVFLANFGLKC